MEEVWKPIAGYEGMYEVSDQGRVKRVAPGNYRTCVGYILKGAVSKAHRHLVLYDQAGTQKTAYVHHLVAGAFLGHKPDGYVIHHIDGDPLNNHARNLQHMPFGKHSRLHATGKFGRRPKLSQEQTADLRIEFCKGRLSYREIGEMYGLGTSSVKNRYLTDYYYSLSPAVALAIKWARRKGRLSGHDVRRIRQMAKTKSRSVIARQIGIGRNYVGAILRGECWADIDTLQGTP